MVFLSLHAYVRITPQTGLQLLPFTASAIHNPATFILLDVHIKQTVQHVLKNAVNILGA
jgi:hypothetical protein